jgi:hypothetical protein
MEVWEICLAMVGMVFVLLVAIVLAVRDASRELALHVADLLRKNREETISFLREIHEKNKAMDEEEIRFLLEANRSINEIGG